MKILPHELVELFVAKHLAEKRGESVYVRQTTGYAPEYDLISANKTLFEVKADWAAEKTNKAAIETHCRYVGVAGLRPSGISVTKAYWWIHVVPQGDEGRRYLLFHLKVDALRRAVVNPAYEVKRSADKALGNSAQITLIPLKALMDLANEHYAITIETPERKPLYEQLPLV